MDMLAQDGTTWRAEFAQRSRPLARRWRRQRLAYRALATGWIPLLAGLFLLGLQRFSLFEVPAGPEFVLFPLPIWLLILLFSYLFDRPPLVRLARAIDEQLELDERLASALELSSDAKVGTGSARLIGRLRLDALNELQTHAEESGRIFPVDAATKRRPLILAGAVAVAIVAAIFVPSPFEAARAEQAAVKTAVLETADKLAALNVETVQKPELDPAASELIQSELSAAETRLRARPNDRGEAVAAISQAEDRLRSLLPDNLREATAARNAAAADIRSSLVAAAAPEIPESPSLANSPESLEALSSLLSELGRTSLFSVAGSIDRAGDTLLATDPEAGAQLKEAADAMRRGDLEAADKALSAAAESLRGIAGAQEQAEFVEEALSQLGDSKQQIAQAGLPQVADDGGEQAAGNRGLGPVDNSENGQGSDTQAGDNAGDGNSSGGSGADSGTGSRPPKLPGSGTAGSGPRDGSGTTNGDPGDGGTGTGQLGTGTGNSGEGGEGEFDPVYVPGASETGDGSGPQDSVSGSLSGNGGETTGGTRSGAGVNPGAQVPYNEVIGSYSDSAAEALDRSALPQDAKDYIRDYFNSLVNQ